MTLYHSIGGEILDYSDSLSNVKSYLSFLLPLRFSKREIERFQYKGSKADHLVKEKNDRGLQEIYPKNRDKVFKL